MNLENFKQAYLMTISESDDSDLKNYIRAIVEEVISDENKYKEAKYDFKAYVVPHYNKNWDNPIGFDTKFVGALEKHVGKYGQEQVYHFYGNENGAYPIWWDQNKKEVKPEYKKAEV